MNELFNEKQLEVINKCIENGHFTSIPSALEGLGAFEMTPEKEKYIDELTKNFRPAPVMESEVKKELQKLEGEGYRIETPEQEREWQAKFDAEREARRQAMIGEQKTEDKIEVKEEKLEEDDFSEVDVESMTKQEVMEALKSKDIKFNPQQKKAELITLLEAQTA